MPDARKLNVVDDNGNVIGEETRERIHREGLLHREVNVWFYTPRGEIIFQHRGGSAESHPNLLDSTVGGHVEIGMDFDDAALQEIEEETGVIVEKKELQRIAVLRMKSVDPVTGSNNNVFRSIYAYRYIGDTNDLKIEDGKGIGFEAWALERVLTISDQDRLRIIPAILEAPTMDVLRKIQERIEHGI